MKVQALIASFVAAPLLLFGGVSSQDINERMARDLDHIHNSFRAKYAPANWKKQHFGWNLSAEIDTAQLSLTAAQSPSLSLYAAALKKFLLSTQDYQVSATFHSTEAATLPFSVVGIEGRYFVSWVNTDHLSSYNYPIAVGDEVILFDDVPIADVVAELKSSQVGQSSSSTDDHLAQILLTNRLGSSGFVVPQGQMTLSVQSPDGVISEYLIVWDYTPQEIHSPSLEALSVQESTSGPLSHRLFAKRMVLPFFSSLKDHKAFTGGTLGPNELGSRQSFVPALGNKVWESSPDDVFYAYIFQTSAGRTVGYVRIPSFDGSADQVASFGDLVRDLQANTDALVIDQVNNPGGSIPYLYAIASYLSDKPLITPKHHLSLTQVDIASALENIYDLNAVNSDRDAQALLGHDVDGYPADYQLAKCLLGYYRFMVDQWRQGRTFTDAFHLNGIKGISPAKGKRYNKPILVLVNELDFSGADLFAAILQDNKRATLFGSRTAGAGGFVDELSYPNPFGVASIHFTASLPERFTRKPVVSLGVEPDVSYELTLDDVRSGYVGYSAAVLAAVEGLFPKAPKAEAPKVNETPKVVIDVAKVEEQVNEVPVAEVPAVQETVTDVAVVQDAVVTEVPAVEGAVESIVEATSEPVASAE